MADREQGSEEGNRLLNMLMEAKRLDERAREVDDSEEESVWMEKFQLIGDMIALLASTVHCPDHGAPTPDQIEAKLRTDEDGMQIDFEGLCCEKLEERVADRVTEFFDEAPGDFE